MWWTSRLFALAFVAAVLLASVVSFAADDVPLPDDREVIAPVAAVPPELARFSGIWGGGKWDGKLAHVLVVESINPDGTVQVVYAWGDYEGWDVERGWERYEAKVSGGRLFLAIPRYDDPAKVFAQVTYTMTNDGTLKGEYLRNSRISKIVLHKE